MEARQPFFFVFNMLKKSLSERRILLNWLVLSIIFILSSWGGIGKQLTVISSLVDPSDCSSSCFRSLSEALRFADPEDTILLEPGVYDQTTERFPITIDKPVTILSRDGQEKTIFVGSRRETVFIITAPNVEIRGITIRHTGSGITVMADNVVIAECYIELLPMEPRVFTCGVWLVGARYAHITGNEFINCGLAMVGPQISSANIDRPSLTGIFAVGHDRQWFTTHVIENNIVNGKPLVYLAESQGRTITEEVGQIILAGCSDITVTGLDICSASIGLQIAHSDGIQVSNSYLEKNSLFGVYIAYSHNCQVKGVEAIGNNHGIDVRVSTAISVSECILLANEQGVFCSYTTDCHISSSVFFNNGVGGFSGSSVRNASVGNRMAENKYAILAQHDTGLTIINNYVEKNELSGIRLSTGCQESTIMANRLVINNVNDILSGAEDTLLFRNYIMSAKLTGVYLWDSPVVSILGNIFNGNSIDLESAGTTEDVVLRLNVFTGNSLSIRNDSAAEIDAKLNYWGIDDEQEVFSRIAGKVVFIPLLKKESLCLGCYRTYLRMSP